MFRPNCPALYEKSATDDTNEWEKDRAVEEGEGGPVGIIQVTTPVLVVGKEKGNFLKSGGGGG